ncbi:MAG: LysM peptidoglycan-binding domain-containing protein [Phycisphaeraceae bacterium]|nr:MAG: LysM peptidoglycan-binding domain-containing protein [Phycisphaeraceae bacterium]
MAPIRPPAGDPPKAPGKAIEPPAFFRYTVKPGDTFQTIAQKFFGSSGKWGVIAKANPLLDPKRLRAGVEVLIPKDETNIQGREIETAGGSAGQGGGTRGGPGAGGGAAGDWSEYVVESGDSLSRVSQKVYGTTRHADAIFEANRATLSSPDRVKVGQRLRIPPKPAG